MRRLAQLAPETVLGWAGPWKHSTGTDAKAKHPRKNQEDRGFIDQHQLLARHALCGRRTRLGALPFRSTGVIEVVREAGDLLFGENFDPN